MYSFSLSVISLLFLEITSKFNKSPLLNNILFKIWIYGYFCKYFIEIEPRELKNVQISIMVKQFNIELMSDTYNAE